MIVLVAFYSRGGATERLATAAAVGAVQGRAAIRLRRMPDVDAAGTLAAFPDHAEALRRMQKEYVAPREADVLAADVLIFASTPDVSASSPEWSALVDLLTSLQSQAKLVGKVGVAIDNGSSFTSFAAMVQRLGLATLPSAAVAIASDDAVQRAVALGRQAVSVADALRAGGRAAQEPG
jgi:flavodoxin